MTGWMANMAAGTWRFRWRLCWLCRLRRRGPRRRQRRRVSDATGGARPGRAGAAHARAQSQAARRQSCGRGGNVMRGSDTPSLVAMLPWWRPPETEGSDPGELESPILTACDVWLGFPFATADAQSLTVRLSRPNMPVRSISSPTRSGSSIPASSTRST